VNTKIRTLAATAVAAAFVLSCALSGVAQAQTRDRIRIVGSSTVFPFTSAVAETFGRDGTFRTPVVESTGTGGGLKLFCGGVGPEHPDLAGASRRIRASEFETCAANGVTGITEIRIGFDGIVVANSKEAPRAALTVPQLWQALAGTVPVGGRLVGNPYRTWSDIDPSLPDVAIEVYGPPPTSGTRDAFVELVMEAGCEAFPEVRALPDDEKKAVCTRIREDGGYVEAGENDNLIVQKLLANPDAFGIFGYGFLDRNADRLQGSTIDGVAPDYDAISSGEYPVSRSLYLYVKNAHVDLVPGIRAFVAEYASERALGEDGYLADKGLIALPEAERARVRARAAGLDPLTM
jgi:phosphate transport system substrate-binding protein